MSKRSVRVSMVGGVRCAEAMWAGAAGVEVFEGDFFKFDARGGFDFIFDYTFFCALPMTMRPEWGARTAKLLKPGRLARILTEACPYV